MNILTWALSFAAGCILLFIIITIGEFLLGLIMAVGGMAVYGIASGIKFIVNSVRRVFTPSL